MTGDYYPMATTTIWYSASTAHSWTPIAEDKPKKRREQMTLYKVYFLDIRRAVVTSEHTLVGRDEADAMLSVSLTEVEKKLKAKDELEVVWQEVGEFEKLKKSRVVIEKDEE